MTQDNGVFINCPFDADHVPVHHAIILTVLACGFEPRSALETGSASLPRMQRIGSALQASRYSIHDLTRAQGNPLQSNLARFNMPFEFGMAFLYSEITGSSVERHDWLGLVPHEHRHAEFISDLAGYDLLPYQSDSISVVPPLMSWLVTRPTAPELPSAINPSVLINLLPELDNLIAVEDLRWGGHLPWVKLVGVIRDLLAAKLA